MILITFWFKELLNCDSYYQPPYCSTGPLIRKLSASGGNDDVSNLLLTSAAVRIDHGSDNDTGIIATMSQRYSRGGDPPQFTRVVRFCGGGLSVTNSSRRRHFRDGNSLNFCGAVRHGTIRMFSPSRPLSRGRQRRQGSNAPSSYLSKLLNLPLVRLGRLDRPTVRLVKDPAYSSKSLDTI